MEKITRGMRNNNPFNIRKSKSRWIGKIKGTDKEFETFDSLEHGYRAGLILLANYYTKYHLHTIFDIITRFAPSTENKTYVYIDWLCRRTGFQCDETLTLRELLVAVAPFIAQYESDCILPYSVVKQIIYNVNKEYE